MTLFQHQIDGAAWLAGRRAAYLGDEPGLGKTRTVLTGIDECHETYHPLIVCPAIVRSHWEREWQALSHAIDVRPIVKSYDEIVRGGYALMRELVEDACIDHLILDEAHYCKHASSQRAQFLLGPNGYARRVGRVWLASGTPMPRNPAELWPQLVNLIPEELEEWGVREYAKWLEMFCITRRHQVRGIWRDKIVGVQNPDMLREILSTVMLRRTLGDVGLDVPPIWWQTLGLDTSYGENVEATAMEPEAQSLAIRAASGWDDTKLADIANDPQIARMRRRLGELKVGPVIEMLRESLENSDEKVVVFAHHRTVLHALREALRGFGVAYIDGDVGPAARDEALSAFVHGQSVRLFVGQNIACQTGMDGLQYSGAHRVVLVEPDWQPDVNFQLAKRVARIGQNAKRVTVQMIALGGTLDEAIVRQCERETRMVESVMN